MNKEITDNPTTKAPFAERITILRTTTGLSQSELAKEVGLTQAQLSKLESGITQDPPLSAISSLASFFSMPINVLTDNNSSEFLRALSKSVDRFKSLDDSNCEQTDSPTSRTSRTIKDSIIIGHSGEKEIKLPAEAYLKNIILAGSYNKANALLAKRIISGWKQKTIIFDMNRSYENLLNNSNSYFNVSLKDLYIALKYVFLEENKTGQAKLYEEDNLTEKQIEETKNLNFYFSRENYPNYLDVLIWRNAEHALYSRSDIIIDKDGLPVPEPGDNLGTYKEILEALWSNDKSIIIDTSSILKSPEKYYSGLPVVSALINILITVFREENSEAVFVIDDYGPLFSLLPYMYDTVSFKPDNIGFILVSEKVFYNSTRYVKALTDTSEFTAVERLALSENTAKTILLTKKETINNSEPTGKHILLPEAINDSHYAEEVEYLNSNSFIGYYSSGGSNLMLNGHVEELKD